MKFRTRAIHVGNPYDPQTGAVIPPVHLASTYVQQAAGEWGAFDYGRSGNPTRKNVETTLASLESPAGSGLAFASGMAAVHAVTMLLRPGRSDPRRHRSVRRHVPAAAQDRQPGRNPSDAGFVPRSAKPGGVNRASAPRRACYGSKAPATR